MSWLLAAHGVAITRDNTVATMAVTLSPPNSEPLKSSAIHAVVIL